MDRTFAVVESAFRNRLEADLVNALRRSASPQLSLVAEAEGVVVGHTYYSRFGFRTAGPLGFSYPGPHDPYLKLLELGPGALSGVEGRIRVHPAFAEVGAE